MPNPKFFGPADPSPGVCPYCMDEGMARATAWITAEHEAGREPTIEKMVEKLMAEAGLTRRWAMSFLLRAAVGAKTMGFFPDV